MMAAMIPDDVLNVTLENWLEYAFPAIADCVIPSSIIIITTVIVFLVVATLGGLCWNREWSIKKNNRWFMVGALALIAAVCLAAGDALCNSNFNSFSGGYNDVTTAFNDEPIDAKVYAEGHKLIAKYVKSTHLDYSEPYAVSSSSVNSHENARRILMYVPLICLLLVILVVSWVSCADIRVFKALDSKK